MSRCATAVGDLPFCRHLSWIRRYRDRHHLGLGFQRIEYIFIGGIALGWSERPCSCRHRHCCSWCRIPVWWCANDVINVARGAASASLPARWKGRACKAYCRLLHLTCLIVRRYPATPAPSLLYCRTAAADKVATSSTAHTITRSAGMSRRMRKGGGGTAEASY